MSRPLKLTKARARQITQAVRKGAPRHTAAAAAGVGKSTLQGWLQRGETKDAPVLYKEFALALRQADAEAELQALEHIQAAGPEDWRAAAWWLSHARSKDYAQRHEVSGPDGGSIGLEGSWNLAELSDTELAELQELANRASGDGS